MEFKTIQDIQKSVIDDDAVYAINGKFLKELCDNYALCEILRTARFEDREYQPE